MGLCLYILNKSQLCHGHILVIKFRHSGFGASTQRVLKRKNLLPRGWQFHKSWAQGSDHRLYEIDPLAAITLQFIYFV